MTIATHPAAAYADPAWIAGHLDDPAVTIVEVDVSPGAYRTGHIPGAVFWGAYGDLRRPDYTPIDAGEFARLVSSSGIAPDSTVVFYGYAAYLGFWLMKRYRHERVRLMDGPRERWADTGHRWSTGVPAPPPSAYPLAAEDADTVVTQEAVERLVSDPATAIVDVRSRPEFDGERFWPSGAEAAGRAGHIPSSTHVPFDLIRAGDGELKSADELRALYEPAGVVPERRVVTYCTIGNRASQVWFVLRYLLGYPRVSVYYGSWAEWGTLPGTPVERSPSGRLVSG